MPLQPAPSNKERLLGATAPAKSDDSSEDQTPTLARRRSASKVDTPLAVTVADAKRLTGVGSTTLYARLNDGTLRSTLVGGRRLIYYASILEMLGLADQDAE